MKYDTQLHKWLPENNDEVIQIGIISLSLIGLLVIYFAAICIFFPVKVSNDKLEPSISGKATKVHKSRD